MTMAQMRIAFAISVLMLPGLSAAPGRAASVEAGPGGAGSKAGPRAAGVAAISHEIPLMPLSGKVSSGEYRARAVKPAPAAPGARAQGSNAPRAEKISEIESSFLKEPAGPAPASKKSLLRRLKAKAKLPGKALFDNETAQPAEEAVLVEKGELDARVDGARLFHALLAGHGVARPASREAREKGFFIASGYDGRVRKVDLPAEAKYLVWKNANEADEDDRVSTEIWERIGPAALFRRLEGISKRDLIWALSPGGGSPEKGARIFVGTGESLEVLDAGGRKVRRIAPPKGQGAGQGLRVYADAYRLKERVGAYLLSAVGFPFSMALLAYSLYLLFSGMIAVLDAAYAAAHPAGLAGRLLTAVAGLGGLLSAAFLHDLTPERGEAENRLLGALISSLKLGLPSASKALLFLRIGAAVSFIGGLVVSAAFWRSLAAHPGVSLFSIMCAGLGLIGSGRAAMLLARLGPRMALLRRVQGVRHDA